MYKIMLFDGYTIRPGGPTNNVQWIPLTQQREGDGWKYETRPFATEKDARDYGETRLFGSEDVNWYICPIDYPGKSPALAKTPKIVRRLEYLRGELRAERISYGELDELQSLVPHIDPGDTELLEAAGVPE